MAFDPSTLIENSPFGILVTDKSERIIWCNSQFLSDTGLVENEVLGYLYQGLPIEAIDRDAQVVQLFDKNSPQIQFRYWQQLLDPDEGNHVHYFAQQTQKQTPASLLALKASSAQGAKDASWVPFLDYEVSRSRRYNNPLSILKLHLLVFDKPATVCETTLHQTIKDTLMNELRWADMIGHTDHGSFLMVLPETPKSALKSLQTKLEKALHRQFRFIDQAINFKVAFGQASWQKNDDRQRLLSRARLDLVSNLEEILEKLPQN